MDGNRNVAWWTVAIGTMAILWGVAGVGAIGLRCLGGDRRADDDRAAAEASETGAPPPLDPGERIPDGLTLSGPITCTGSNDLVIERKYVRSSGDGVAILGACDVTLVDSVIVARGAGIRVSGAGDVEVRGGTISGDYGIRIDGAGDVELESVTLSGRKKAVLVNGAGEVGASDSKIHGDVEVNGWGGFRDDGGNLRD